MHIHSGDWPVLLYDMQTYKDGDFKTGLLQSPIMEAVSVCTTCLSMAVS